MAFNSLIPVGSIFKALKGKFSRHTHQKPNRHDRSWKMSTLLIGQRNSDQSEPCRSEDNMVQCIVNGCKTVQVTSNCVTMSGEIVHFSGSGSSLTRRKHTRGKKVTRSFCTCMIHSKVPRTVFGSRMKPTIYSVILWHKILLILQQLQSN